MYLFVCVSVVNHILIIGKATDLEADSQKMEAGLGLELPNVLAEQRPAF